MISFAIVPGGLALAQTTTEAGTFNTSAPGLPGSLKTTPLLDAWIRIAPNGQVSVAMRELALAARWQAGAPLPDPQTVHDFLMSLPSQDIVVAEQGAAPAAIAPATTLKARYSRPNLTHGSIGPSCALAQLDNGVLTIWAHTQGVYPLREGLAQMLAMPHEKVRCIHVEGSGCYGHNGADDVAADAALIARELPGRPVRVQLMREQEHRWEPFGPAMIVQASASLDSSGSIVDGRYELWSDTHNNRIANAGRLLPAQLLSPPFTPAPPKPIPIPEGGGDRNSIPLYRLPGLHVRYHFLPPDGVRNQIEGGILQVTSWTLYEQTHFDRQHITSFDWRTYPIMRFSSVPGQVDVVLIDRPGRPFLGVGEAAQGPAAAALANAIHDATGVRIRDLPLLGATQIDALKA